MSDLDDFFAKRLDEEASFPNRGKNWKQMSQRLDAFDSGTVHGKRTWLRSWQLATILAVTTAGILFWRTHTAHLENKVLHQENKALQQKIATLETEHDKLSTRLDEAIQQPTEPSAGTSPIVEKAMPEQGSRLLPLTPSQRNPKTTPLADLPPKSKANTSASSTSNPIALQTSSSETKATTVKAYDTTSTKLAVQESVNPSAQTASVEAVPQALVQSVETTPGLLPQDSLKIQEPLPGQEETPVVASVEAVKKDSIASVPAKAADIKPQHLSMKNRFRVGAQATFGFVQPREKGVSALKGQGFNFEARIFRSLWASASVDWIHHEVSTEKFVPKFHPHHDSLPEPPNSGGGGGGHSSKLVLVESAPREQHFALGLRYEIPLKFWVRPSIRVMHEWTHVSPTLVTYKYEEENPGGPGGPGWHDHDPEYTAEKFDAQWLSNQWRLGIGLEKDIPQWTFGLWADYSRDFSAATPSFDALYVRAGAQFRF